MSDDFAKMSLLLQQIKVDDVSHADPKFAKFMDALHEADPASKKLMHNKIIARSKIADRARALRNTDLKKANKSCKALISLEDLCKMLWEHETLYNYDPSTEKAKLFVEKIQCCAEKTISDFIIYMGKYGKIIPITTPGDFE